jgi:hypothetical protein
VGKVLANRSMKLLGYDSTLKPCHETSYKVAYCITKQMRPHRIVETLVEPCALEIFELVCGLEQRMKTEALPALNDVIHSTPTDTSLNILKQVMAELAGMPFPSSMQMMSLSKAFSWISLAMCMLTPS